MAEPVTPPPGVELRTHMGGCIVEMDREAKLPHGAVAWGWEGADWLPPESWPLGVWAEGELEAEMRKSRIENQEVAHDNNFDERGAVPKLGPEDLENYKPRPKPPRPRVPPGVTFRQE